MITIATNSDNDIYTDNNGRLSYIYNPEAFTVVGSPIITSNGIASGFSGSDFIVIPMIDYSNANSWAIYSQKFSISSLSSLNTIFCNYTYTNNQDGICIFIRNTGKTSWSVQSALGTNIFKRDANTNFQPNIEYQFKLEFTGSAYNLYLSTNGSSFVLIDTYTSSTKANINISLAIGKGLGQYWQGNPIDLKPFSVTIDGVKVFSGTKIAQSSNLVLSQDINALANISRNVVLTTLGEPEYNQQDGIPYFETVFTDTPKIDLLQAAQVAALEKLEDVNRVSSYEYNQSNGIYSYSLVEHTTFGDIQLNG